MGIQDQIVIIGDCLDCMTELEPETIDIALFSPPYNLNIAYRSYVDYRPRAEYLHWLDRVAQAVHRLLKLDGSLFLNIGGSNTDPWLSSDVANVFRQQFFLQNHITWVKSISIGDDTVGHFKPINSRRYLNYNHEAIFHFTKTGTVTIDRLAVGVPFKDKSNIARRGHAQDRRCAGNVWYIPYETVQSRDEKFDHPASFPLGLAKRCLKLHGVMAETVILDPFLGAGTTLIAAADLGCHGIGIEIDAAYAARARLRLQHFYETME